MIAFEALVSGTTYIFFSILAGRHAILEGVKILENHNWAIAGRNKIKLEDTLKIIERKTSTDLSHISIVIADVNDENSLLKMTAKAKVKKNTVSNQTFEANVKCVKLWLCNS